MSADPIDGVKDRLIEAARNKCFLSALDHESRGNRENIGLLLAELHNAGNIDLVAEFLELRKNEAGIDFFLTRHLFQGALPKLNAAVPEVMKCVKYLAEEAGDDLAASLVYGEFREYCQAHPERPDEAISLALNENEEWKEFLCASLWAGEIIDSNKFFNLACDLSASETEWISALAVFALGFMKYEGRSEYKDPAITAIEQAVNKHGSNWVRANAIKSYFEINKALEIEEQRFIELYKESSCDLNDAIIHAISETICHQTGNVPNCILQFTIDILAQVNPNNKGTIDLIDITLRKLIDLGHHALALELVEKILITNADAASILLFDSFTSAALTSTNGFFDQVVTRWLASRSTWLCMAIPEMLGSVGGTPVALNFNSSMTASPETIDYIFIARKACGWLFMNPVSAGSYIVSLLEQAPEESITDISNILMNPLLISYSGDLRSHLEDSLPTRPEKIQQLLKSIFTAIDNYHKDLDSVRGTPELLPPTAHRETHSRSFNRKMSESLKEAQNKSIINQIATKYVLLHGRKSIFYTHSLDGSPPARQESMMHTFSHSIESPSLDRIDPHRLDYELRLFRVEGCDK